MTRWDCGERSLAAESATAQPAPFCWMERTRNHARPRLNEPSARKIVTVEGASRPVVDAVREAWYRGNVVQCGYCQPGQTLAAISLLESNPVPGNATIAMWMNGNLCRCGAYPRIKDAIQVAAETLASGTRPPGLTARPEPETAPLSPEELADPSYRISRSNPTERCSSFRVSSRWPGCTHRPCDDRGRRARRRLRFMEWGLRRHPDMAAATEQDLCRHHWQNHS
jgi:hypothetical protein